MYVLSKNRKNIKLFQVKIFIFTTKIFSVYLHGLVFIMGSKSYWNTVKCFLKTFKSGYLMSFSYHFQYIRFVGICNVADSGSYFVVM